jgi:hypothetical protein
MLLQGISLLFTLRYDRIEFLICLSFTSFSCYFDSKLSLFLFPQKGGYLSFDTSRTPSRPSKEHSVFCMNGNSRSHGNYYVIRKEVDILVFDTSRTPSRPSKKHSVHILVNGN